MTRVSNLVTPGDPIKHVVYVMFENRSFDHMLGDATKIYPGLEGVDQSKPRYCEDFEGNRYLHQPTTVRQLLIDPEHSVPDSALQMNFGAMDGFVRDYKFLHPEATPEELAQIMGYFPFGFLPADHMFAQYFQIFDHWHASLPGPTWPNRLFSLLGTSRGLANMPPGTPSLGDLDRWFENDQPSIFDRLNEAGVNWEVFYHDIPFSLLLKGQRKFENAARYSYIDRFYKLCTGPESEFPQFAYIEPRYQGLAESDDHPPHDIMKGQKLKADLYNAIFANKELRNSTLFIITYDEHGGLFDHVHPPAAVPPDNNNREYAFNQLGLRVPTYLISPWVEAGFDSTVYDHTSVLKYLQEKWGLGDLGDRTAAANNFAHLIGRRQTPRTDFPLRIELTADQLSPPDKAADAATEDLVNHLNLSFTGLGAYLERALCSEYIGLARVVVKIKAFYRRHILHRKPTAHDPVALAEYRTVQDEVPEFVDYARRNLVARHHEQ